MPRARGLPLVGSIPALMRHQLDFFEQARRRCGNIYAVDFGVNEIVIVADPELADEIFTLRSKNFGKGAEFWDGLRDAFGNGLVFSEGEVWRRQRRLMNPEFRKSRIDGFRETMSATIDELLDELDGPARSGAAMDISLWTSRLLATLTVRLLFGGDQLDPLVFARLREALQLMLDSVLPGVVTRKLPSWVPLPGAKRFAAARQTIDEIIFGIIATRRASGGSRDDLLGMLLAATDEDGSMDDRQLRDEVVVLYVAGYETTAWTLAWGLMLLAQEPGLVAELQAELEANSDLASTPLLDATIKETMRLYPSAPLIPRSTLVDEELRGYRIPSGTTILVMPWLIHRDSELWPEPARFDPRRHLGATDRHKLAWIPFGAGQRACIGKGLAMMETRLALAKLLRRFTPQPARGRPRPEPRLSMTLSTRDGIWLRLEGRQAWPVEATDTREP